MIRRNTFESKFPMFVDLITDPNMRQSMLNNNDLVEKCSNHNSLISTFMHELTIRFDDETVYDILGNTVFKYHENIMVEFITAYLNSENSVKADSNVYNYYNKIIPYGEACIKYVSENGIISNSKRYRNLPNEVIIERFKVLATPDIKLGHVYISSLINDLPIDVIEYVNYLLENNLWYFIESSFKSINISPALLLPLLNRYNVDNIIFNDKVEEALGENIYRGLLYNLIVSNNISVTDNVKELIVMDRFNELKYFIIRGELEKLNIIDPLVINSMSFDDILSCIKRDDYQLTKGE